MLPGGVTVRTIPIGGAGGGCAVEVGLAQIREGGVGEGVERVLRREFRLDGEARDVVVFERALVASG